MPIDANSKAAVNAVGARNVQFQPSVSNVPSQVACIATYDPALLDVIDNEPVRIFNASDGGVKFGFGTMIHRLIAQAFAGSRGEVPVWAIPQSEVAGAASEGSIDFAGSTGVKAGALPFYVAALPAFPALVDAETEQDIALKLIATVNADDNLPVSAAIDGVIDTKVNFTAKSQGPWGDDITFSLALRPGEAVPAGVTFVITDMTGGSGVPDIQDALDGTGTGDNQNQEFFTHLLCGYGADTATLDKISVYNGTGNDFNGNYKQEIARPFNALTGDTAPGTAGLTALIAVADLRAELDRTNGIVSEPGSFHHPMEIAAVTMGLMARVSNIRAQENYLNKILPGLIQSPQADRWTNDYDNRDLAVRSGISTTLVKNNTITAQDIITFYRPAAVNPESNGWRSMRNTAIIRNKLANLKAEFEREKWQGITIVDDVTIVDDQVDKDKVRETLDVENALLALNELFAGKSWIFDVNFFIERLKANPDLVSLRTDGRGWNTRYQTVLSGEGGIFNTEIQFDVSLAVFI